QPAGREGRDAAAVQRAGAERGRAVLEGNRAARSARTRRHRGHYRRQGYRLAERAREHTPADRPGEDRLAHALVQRLARAAIAVAADAVAFPYPTLFRSQRAGREGRDAAAVQRAGAERGRAVLEGDRAARSPRTRRHRGHYRRQGYRLAE